MAAAARAHAPVRSVSMPYAPPMLGPRKRSIYVRVQANDARHLTASVDRMFRCATRVIHSSFLSVCAH